MTCAAPSLTLSISGPPWKWCAGSCSLSNRASCPTESQLGHLMINYYYFETHCTLALSPETSQHLPCECVDRTPEGMAGISAKSAFWLCHSFGVKWPGRLKALFFQCGDSASGKKVSEATPWGAPPRKFYIVREFVSPFAGALTI